MFYERAATSSTHMQVMEHLLFGRRMCVLIGSSSIGRNFEHFSNAIDVRTLLQALPANSLRMEGVEDAHIRTPLLSIVLLLIFSSSNILECNFALWKIQRRD